MQDSTTEVSLTRLPFTGALAFAFFMGCKDSAKIWISLCLRLTTTLISRCIFSLSLMSLPLSDELDIKKKDKKSFGKVESAFLKDTTEVYDISFQTEKSIKIKIEVDINPPLNFSTEQKLLMEPCSFMTRCFTLPGLFAGKMHALVYRAWKNRVKGRDWYDFEWYVRNRTPLDFKHLQERIKEFNGRDVSKDEFLSDLKERLGNSDIKQVKADVAPFVKNPKELEIWSNDYFLQIMNLIRFEE